MKQKNLQKTLGEDEKKVLQKILNEDEKKFDSPNLDIFQMKKT